MRAFPSLAVVALLLAASVPAVAQQPSFTETFQVRAAFGDIPTTTAQEPAGTWNIEQRLEIAAGSARAYFFDLPPQATVLNASCTCGAVTYTVGSDGAIVDAPTTTQGEILTVTSQSQADEDTFAFQIQPPTADPSQVLIIYAPRQTDVELPGDSDEVGLTTDGTAVIHYTSGSASDALPSPLWASVHPESGGGSTVAAPNGAGMNWLLVGIAFILGMILWAFLVARGAVQTRTRKQVVATPGHVEAARVGRPVLEARKRALMAGLKDLEMAKMNKELDDATYDQVKGEFKAEAVTTMRAIEQADGASPKKA